MANKKSLKNLYPKKHRKVIGEAKKKYKKLLGSIPKSDTHFYYIYDEKNKRCLNLGNVRCYWELNPFCYTNYLSNVTRITGCMYSPKEIFKPKLFSKSSSSEDILEYIACHKYTSFPFDFALRQLALMTVLYPDGAWRLVKEE